MKTNSTIAVVVLFLIALALAGPTRAAHTVLVEAESFADRGGWVIDTQSIDQMGSPYLLAHGLGVPVEDATTTIELPAAGRYHVWVRTRDWVAPWHVAGSPGRFQLIVNGQALKTTFGTKPFTSQSSSGSRMGSACR